MPNLTPAPPSAAERSKFRRLAESAGTWTFLDAARPALPRLLDALEAEEAKVRRLREFLGFQADFGPSEIRAKAQRVLEETK